MPDRDTLRHRLLLIRRDIARLSAEVAEIRKQLREPYAQDLAESMDTLPPDVIRNNIAQLRKQLEN